MLQSTLRLSVGMFSAFIIIVGGLIAFTALIFRFDLIWIDPHLITLGFGVCLMITSFLLRIAEARRASRWFATIGGALILSFTIGRILTRTTIGRAALTFIDWGSGAVQTAADITVAPRRVPCEPPFFIGEDSHHRYYYSPTDPQLNCYECYSRKACEHLIPISLPIAAEKMGKKAEAPPTPPTPQATLPPVTEHKGEAFGQPPPIVEDGSGAQYALPHI